jgi:hypothetical protein
MSPQAGEVLVGAIMPIIQATVHAGREARRIGNLRRARPGWAGHRGRHVGQRRTQGTAAAAEDSTAYFTLQHLKQGRRSYQAGRTDVLSPGTIFDQKLCLDSLDEVIQGCEGDEMSMHDLLASASENPASQAARELDWADVLLDCNERDAALLACTAAGGCLGDLAARYGVSSARLCQQKREIGRQVKLRWGEDALADAVREPTWTSHMRANHERAACRHERASEARASAS